MCQPALSPTPLVPQFWICSEASRLVCAWRRGEGEDRQDPGFPHACPSREVAMLGSLHLQLIPRAGLAGRRPRGLRGQQRG